jgi:hypothetical protein
MLLRLVPEVFAFASSSLHRTRHWNAVKLGVVSHKYGTRTHTLRGQYGIHCCFRTPINWKEIVSTSSYCSSAGRRRVVPCVSDAGLEVTWSLRTRNLSRVCRFLNPSKIVSFLFRCSEGYFRSNRRFCWGQLWSSAYCRLRAARPAVQIRSFVIRN